MGFPDNLQTALNNQVADVNTKDLLNAAHDISLRYRRRGNTESKNFIKNDIEALAYAVARMPATYGAVQSALNYTFENIKNKSLNISSLLDIGAGTGAAAWAVNEIIDADSIVCVENNAFMRNLGKTLMRNASGPLKSAEWENSDISDISDISVISADSVLCRADLVIASYVINEIDENIQIKIAEKLWYAAKKILLFVETGTPDGYRALNKIRTKLLEHNAHILAPCFHENICPVSETESDWCHFTCRIQRSRLHKSAKNGDAPFEDEKYSYLALTKENIADDSPPVGSVGSADYAECARILRHPQIGKGHVKLNLCTKNGLKQVTYSKSQGGVYKSARKANCGDKIIFT